MKNSCNLCDCFLRNLKYKTNAKDNSYCRSKRLPSISGSLHKVSGYHRINSPVNTDSRYQREQSRQHEKRCRTLKPHTADPGKQYHHCRRYNCSGEIRHAKRMHDDPTGNPPKPSDQTAAWIVLPRYKKHNRKCNGSKK